MILPIPIKEANNSNNEIAEYWGDATIEAIHDRVLEWNSTRRIERK